MSFMAKRFRSVLIKECERMIDEAKIAGYSVEHQPLVGATVCTVAVGNKQLSYAAADIEIESMKVPLIDHARGLLKQIIERLEVQ